MKITEAKQVREGLYKAIFASLFAKSIERDQECSYWCKNENNQLLCDKNNILTSIQNDVEPFSEEMVETFFSYIDCYIKNKDNFDKIITKYLKSDFSIDKLAKTDISIIYTAMSEVVANDKLSEKIIVSEAVELAKKFAGENSYKFVNGILRNIVKELRNE